MGPVSAGILAISLALLCGFAIYNIAVGNWKIPALQVPVTHTIQRYEPDEGIICYTMNRDSRSLSCVKID